MPFSKIEDAIEDIKSGAMIIIVDDEDRENEGDLVMAAELVTAEDINVETTIMLDMLSTIFLGEYIEAIR